MNQKERDYKPVLGFTIGMILLYLFTGAKVALLLGVAVGFLSMLHTAFYLAVYKILTKVPGYLGEVIVFFVLFSVYFTVIFMTGIYYRLFHSSSPFTRRGNTTWIENKKVLNSGSFINPW